jgi:hypothetical protein
MAPRPVKNAAVKNNPTTSRETPIASWEKAALAFEATPPFLREDRFFVLEYPFADLPKVFRVIRFLVAMRPSLAQKKKCRREALYMVPPVN